MAFTCSRNVDNYQNLFCDDYEINWHQFLFSDIMGKCVLVTGGAGFIGSHTVVEMLNKGFEAVIVDSLINSSLGKLNQPLSPR